MLVETPYKKDKLPPSFWGKWDGVSNLTIVDTSTQVAVGLASTLAVGGNVGVASSYPTATIITAGITTDSPIGITTGRLLQMSPSAVVLEHHGSIGIVGRKSGILGEYDIKNEKEVYAFLEQHSSLRDYLVQIGDVIEGRLNQNYSTLVLELKYAPESGEIFNYLEIGIKTMLDPVEAVAKLQEVFDDIDENHIDSSLIAITYIFE